MPKNPASIFILCHIFFECFIQHTEPCVTPCPPSSSTPPLLLSPSRVGLIELNYILKMLHLFILENCRHYVFSDPIAGYFRYCPIQGASTNNFLSITISSLRLSICSSFLIITFSFKSFSSWKWDFLLKSFWGLLGTSTLDLHENPI